MRIAIPPPRDARSLFVDEAGSDEVHAAAASVEAIRTPLLDELEKLLERFVGLGRPAQVAVAAVAAAIAEDDGATYVEQCAAATLVARRLALQRVPAKTKSAQVGRPRATRTAAAISC
jgi:hypothetical protein